MFQNSSNGFWKRVREHSWIVRHLGARYGGILQGFPSLHGTLSQHGWCLYIDLEWDGERMLPLLGILNKSLPTEQPQQTAKRSYIEGSSRGQRLGLGLPDFERVHLSHCLNS